MLANRRADTQVFHESLEQAHVFGKSVAAAGAALAQVSGGLTGAVVDISA